MSNTLVVRVGADIQGFQSEMKRLTKDTNKLGQSLIGFGSTLSKKVTAPLVGLATASVKTAMGFERSMSKVRTTVSGTEDDFSILSETARYFGRHTEFSANQVASAMSAMGLATLSATEIHAALPATIALATASNMDLASATASMTNVLGVFAKEGSYATYVADTMTQANKLTAVSISDIEGTLLNAGSAINAFGISLQDATKMTILMADGSLTGKKAGTQLRALFDDLARSAVENADAFRTLGIRIFDANGNMLPAMDIVHNLRGAFDGMSDATRTATFEALELGVQAQKALNPILAASGERLDELAKYLYDTSGAAEHYANIMRDNLHYQLRLFWGQITDIGITIGNVFLPALRNAVGRATDFANTIGNKVSPEMAENIVKWGAIAAAIGPALIVGGKAIIMFGQMKAALTILAGAKGTVLTAGGKLPGVLGLGTKAASKGTVALGANGLTGALAKTAKALLGVKTAPLAVGLGAVGLAAYGAHMYFSRDAVPSVDLFRESTKMAADGTRVVAQSISEDTRKISESFLEMKVDVERDLIMMKNQSFDITDEQIEGLKYRTQMMTDNLIEELKRQRDEGLHILEERLRAEGELDETAIQERLENRSNAWQVQIDEAKYRGEEMNGLIRRNLDNEQEWTADHTDFLRRLMGEHTEQMLGIATQDAGERALIMANFRTSEERLTAESFGRLVQMSHEHAEEMRGVARVQAEREMADLNAHFNSGETITDEHLQAILRAHLNNFQGTEDEATAYHQAMYTHLRNHQQQELRMTEEQMTKIQDEIARGYQAQTQEIEDALQSRLDAYENKMPGMSRVVDRETGNMLTWWQRMVGGMNRTTITPQNVNHTVTTTNRVVTQNVAHGPGPIVAPQNTIPGRNANGTSDWGGGLTWVNERGPELINLPGGTEIIPAPLSRLMMREAGRSIAASERRHEPVYQPQQQSIYVTLDKRIVGQILADEISKNQTRNSAQVRAFSGVTI